MSFPELPHSDNTDLLKKFPLSLYLKFINDNLQPLTLKMQGKSLRKIKCVFVNRKKIKKVNHTAIKYIAYSNISQIFNMNLNHLENLIQMQILKLRRFI